MAVKPGYRQHAVEKARPVVETQMNARLAGAVMAQEQAGNGCRVQKRQAAEVEVQVGEIDLSRKLRISLVAAEVSLCCTRS
ncbi:MAG: hypothetical protein WAO18_09015 [Mycobacterium sp.]